MKYVKMLGLLAVAAAAFMAFAGSASAGSFTDENGNVITPTIHAVSEGHVILHNSFTTIECNSTVEGKVEQHGPSITAKGKITTLLFTNCTGGKTVTVKNAGELEVHTDHNDPTGTSGNATLTSTGAEITIQDDNLGLSCVYTTNGTHIGTLTGSKHQLATDPKTKTKTATLDIASAAIPRTGHSAFCGSSGTWTGSYEVISPDYLDYH